MQPCTIKKTGWPTHFCGGFTVIEVMFVLIMLAILSSLAYPAYGNAVRKARRAEGRAALMKLMQQQERFYTTNNRYVAFSSALSGPDETQFRWYSGETPATSSYEISAVACDGESILDCVELTARAGTAKVNANHKDAICPALSLTSTGKKSATDASCWS